MKPPAKKEKAGEVMLHTIEEINKFTLSFLPGGAILDSFLEFRARLKQKRIIEFSDSLKKALENCAGIELHSSNFETEEFIDVMELVYRKVHSTKSHNKLKYFRNILFRQIVEPISLETTLTYTHILDEMNELELILIHDVSIRPVDEIMQHTIFDILFGPENNSLRGRPIILNGEEVFTNDNMLQYHLDRLVSIGLLSKTKEKFKTTFLYNAGEETSKSIEREFINITGAGKDFLKFIKDPDSI